MNQCDHGKDCYFERLRYKFLLLLIESSLLFTNLDDLILLEMGWSECKDNHVVKEGIRDRGLEKGLCGRWRMVDESGGDMFSSGWDMLWE